MNETFQRKYDTILDLFSNVGGSMEFIIIGFTVLFSWYDNLSRKAHFRHLIARHFELPGGFRPKSPYLWSLCSKKPNRETREALDEIADEGVAFENLVKLTTVMSFITNVLIPEELWKVVPLVAFLDKQVEVKKKSGHQTQGAPNKVGPIGSPGGDQHRRLDSSTLPISSPSLNHSKFGF